jgi:hypothetical protein
MCRVINEVSKACHHDRSSPTDTAVVAADSHECAECEVRAVRSALMPAVMVWGLPAGLIWANTLCITAMRSSVMTCSKEVQQRSKRESAGLSMLAGCLLVWSAPRFGA